MVEFESSIASNVEQAASAQTTDADLQGQLTDVEPLDREHFRRCPQLAQEFSAGPEGAILRAVAMVTAANSRKLIAGHLILGGPEELDSIFVITPAYQKIFYRDNEVSLLSALAPLLIEHEILGQSEVYQHLNAISDACQKFGIADYMNDIEAAARHVIKVCSTGENFIWFKNFVDLSIINYGFMQTAIASRRYEREGYTVIPSTILKTLCGTSVSDRLWAWFRTQRARTRRYAVSRVIDERASQAAPASRS